MLLLAVWAAAPAAQANTLVTVAYDGFDYPTGSLTGRDGGTGWTGPWTGGSPLGVNTTGLTYPNLTVEGGTTEFRTSLNSSNRRCTDLQDSGVVFLQFLSNFSANHGGGTPNIRISAGGAQTGAIGNNNIPGVSTMTIMDAGLNLLAASGTPIAQLNLTVVRIDHEADVTDMWVNPNLSNFDYLSPPTADATAANFSPDLECIEPITRNAGSFDEIKIMRLELSPEGSSEPGASAQETLTLESPGGVTCSSSNAGGVRGSWVSLPTGDDCRIADQPEGRVLGWATTSDFPVEIAQRQVDNGWGAYEIFNDDGSIASVFIPAGGSTFLSGSTRLFPVIG
jgi:hypothetical protein